MSANTTFWRYAVVALAVFGSAVAVPLSAVDETAKNDDNRPLNVELTSSEPFVASNPTDGTVEQPVQLQSETASVGSDFPVVSATGPSLSTVANEEKTGADVPAKTGADTVAVQQLENVQVSDPQTAAAGPDSSSVGPGPGPSSKPYYRPASVQTVQFGGPPASMPLLMEFLQPFQPFGAFQPFSPFVPDNRKQPIKQHFYQPFPFGAPADPFASAVPSFNQLVNAYTNEFRNMLASLDKDMSQMGNADNMPDKPLNKTTSKTEIIDGHVVQTNETVYSNGDANHKSFFHIKEIKVIPESMNNKKIGNEAVTTPVIPTDDLDKKKEDTNEIRPDSSVETFAVDDFDKQNSIKKVDQ